MEVLTGKIYRECLDKILGRICFEKNSGEFFSFEELFYPLELEEGRFAFQNHADQMSAAHELHRKQEENQHTGEDISEQIKVLTRKLRQGQKRYGTFLSSVSFSLSADNAAALIHPQESNTVAFRQKTAPEPEPPAEMKKYNDRVNQLLSYEEEDAQDVSVPSDVFLQESLRKTAGTVLEEEKEYDHGSLTMGDNGTESRILVMASAGHGKTTLLKRTALWYSHSGSATAEHIAFQQKYAVSGQYIPCLIYLRDFPDKEFSIEKMIRYAIGEVLKTDSHYRNCSAEERETALSQWLDTIQRELILLIDGLDELSDSLRYQFLQALEEYLSQCPKTPIIMTSRAAGLSDSRIVSLLLKMRFRGRSIIPLTNTTAARYATLWIEKTQPEEMQALLKDSVRQILTQNQYYYLREFLRTPLELILILRQVAGDKLSINRFQMFHDTLWEYFTNHVQQYHEKRFVFEDTMTFLGFLAYQMQLKDSMYLSLRELEGLMEELKALSFHTDYIGSGHVDYCRVQLDKLASSVGIIERDIRSDDIVYTFPIRAYQEFLTAHACCHLCLTPQAYAPQPYEILHKHIEDSRWSEVISFALYDLEVNNAGAVDRLIRPVFEKIKDLAQLKSVVEGNLFVSRENAAILCRNIFSQPWLNHEQRDYLAVCMKTNSASSYVFALNSAYQAGGDANVCLEALALALIRWECSIRESPWERAMDCLQGQSAVQVRLGAMMIVEMTKSMLGETLKDDTDFIADCFVLTEELLTLLYRGAKQWQELLCVSALTNLWLVCEQDWDRVAAYLQEDMEAVVLAAMEKHRLLFRRLMIGRVMDTRSPDFKTALQMVYTLGTFPLKMKDTESRQRVKDPFIVGYCHFLYNHFLQRGNFDRAALTKVLLYCDWKEKEFAMAWAGELCGGLPSVCVEKYLLRSRNRQHFERVRQSLASREETYLANYRNSLPVWEETQTVDTFLERDDINGALEYCVRTMGKQAGSDALHLAFLMRFGHRTAVDSVTGQPYHITRLLMPEVLRKNPYALMNLFLYDLENRRRTILLDLLQQITPEGWQEITERFWYPVVWQRLSHPEGALVCVLAEHYGGLHFEDSHLMQLAARQHYDVFFYANGIVGALPQTPQGGAAP